MKAVYIDNPGPDSMLRLSTYPDPEPKEDELLIDVRAAGINRPDIAQRLGKYPAPEGVVADIPGLEVAGVVIATGEKVTDFQIGNRVCALVAGGGYAAKVSVYEGQCLPLPEQLTFIEGAAMPETFFTVWTNVFERGRLQPGERLLIHGGSSGIGTTAIQLAQAFGASSVVTVGSDEKGERCMALGATQFVNYKKEEFSILIKRNSIDVVLDMIGAPYLSGNLDVLKEEGRLIFINGMKGIKTEVNILKIMQKRLTISGSTLRSRSKADKRLIRDALLKNVWPKLISNDIRPVIDSVYPLNEAGEAHRRMESSAHIGKIVLSLQD